MARRINREQTTKRLRQIGWFILIWAASVLTLAIVGLLIRAILR
ncbi:MAG: DUF2474 domain-containing protein [Sphingomonadaceae bacterium]